MVGKALSGAPQERQERLPGTQLRILLVSVCCELRPAVDVLQRRSCCLRPTKRMDVENWSKNGRGQSPLYARLNTKLLCLTY